MLITLLSLIFITALGIANLILAFKTFQRLNRVDTVGRRDQLFNKLSELTKTNSDGHHIAARFSNAKIAKRFVTAPNESASKDLESQIARLNEIENTIDDQRAAWEKEIQAIYLSCINLPQKTAPALIERQITLVQFTSDYIKQRYAAYLGLLHSLETTTPMQKESGDDMARLANLKVELDHLMNELRTISGITKKPPEGG